MAAVIVKTIQDSNNKDVNIYEGMTSIRKCMITQNVKNPETSEIYIKDETKIKEMLEEWDTVKKYAYIKHGRPVQDVEDHYHIAIEFKTAVPTEALLKKFWKYDINIHTEQIEKSKKLENAVAYLTHEDKSSVDSGKPKYDRNIVVSNYNYQDDIERVKSKQSLNKDLNRCKEIVDRISQGDWLAYDLNNYVTDWEQVQYSREIEHAKKLYNSRIKQEDRDMHCIYIQGEPGLGKTTMAKELARQMKLNYFVSSASNDILYGYQDEPCIILDDMRQYSMYLNDLLKMLDNNTSSTIKSRYFNKAIKNCKLIIITSVKPIEQLYSDDFSDGESVVQLKRRCACYYKFIDTERIDMYIYDSERRDYIYKGSLPNDYYHKFDSKRDIEQEFEFFKNMLGQVGKKLVLYSENMKLEVAPTESGATDRPQDIKLTEEQSKKIMDIIFSDI